MLIKIENAIKNYNKGIYIQIATENEDYDNADNDGNKKNKITLDTILMQDYHNALIIDKNNNTDQIIETALTKNRRKT